MSARTLYRIIAVMFVLFAAGHTVGFLTFKAATAEGIAVRDAMGRVNIGDGFTWGGFYTGFGLSITATTLFYAFLAWSLGDLAAQKPRAVAFIAWSFFAFQLPGLVLAFIYFPGGPIILSSIVAICLGWAAWLTTRAGRAAAQ